MNIGCVGWGSLVWNPKDFPVQRNWFKDGPLLPIEFARQSNSGYITLVIVPEVRSVRCLWSPLIVPDIETARVKLAEREGIAIEDIERFIGYWQSANSHYGYGAEVMGKWAMNIGLDAVIWTNLQPKFQGENRVPSENEVISFLQNLPSATQKMAEEYIRKAPRQIDTELRRLIETRLGWYSISKL